MKYMAEVTLQFSFENYLPYLTVNTVCHQYVFFKMADIEVCGECSSHISVKIKVNNNVTNCKKCSEYETQLKEALDELKSVRMINELLQKELLTCVTQKSTLWIEPDSNRNDVQPFENGPSEHSSKMSYSEMAAAGGKWITAVHSLNKKKKMPTVSAVATEQSYLSSNRFTPLTNLIENQTVEINPRSNCEWPSATNCEWPSATDCEWPSATNSIKKKTLCNLVLAIKYPL